jgi:hypothetical protein
VQRCVAGADGAQPPGVHGEGVERLPDQVELPLALVVAVQATCVQAGHLAPELPHRLPRPERLDDRGAEQAPDRAALEVQPGRVQHGPDQRHRSPVVGPQRQDQAAGGVRRADDVVVAVAPGDQGPGGVELGEVLVQVGDVVGRLVLAEGAAVLAQVDRVEVVPAGVPPRGVLGLEEVVGEPVHVQDRLAGGGIGPPADQGGDDRALGVVRELEGLGLERLAQDVRTDVDGVLWRHGVQSVSPRRPRTGCARHGSPAPARAGWS